MSGKGECKKDTSNLYSICTGCPKRFLSESAFFWGILYIKLSWSYQRSSSAIKFKLFFSCFLGWGGGELRSAFQLFFLILVISVSLSVTQWVRLTFFTSAKSSTMFAMTMTKSLRGTLLHLRASGGQETQETQETLPLSLRLHLHTCHAKERDACNGRDLRISHL